MLCFQDISYKILADTSKAEGELLSLINSTISHEMRNPLNSIINQCKILFAMIAIFKTILGVCSSVLSNSVFSKLEEVYTEISKSVSIMSSSSNLLLLNVEDILGFAQIKAGRFVKDVKKFNIKRAIEEIVAIQQYQAETKNIVIQTEFFGFPPKNPDMVNKKGRPVEDPNLIIASDEKRFK